MADPKTCGVEASAVGEVTGTDPRTGIDVVTYHSKGAEVELDAKTAERLLGLGAIADPATKKAQEAAQAKAQEAAAQAFQEALEAQAAAAEEQAKAEAAATGAGTEETGEQLTR